MNQETALNIVKSLMYGLQKFKSITVEELTRMGWEEDTVKKVLSDLAPWSNGEKGYAFINSLSSVLDRGKVTGSELYNFMSIIHLLDRNLLHMVQGVSETIFPEPDIKWISELGM